jgi:Phage major capsid protein E
MALNFDLIEPGVLTGFVRELPVPANYTLNTWLPDRNIGDIEVAFETAFKRNRAAQFRAFDAETPIGERDNFQRSRVSLPPISQKMLVGEEERLKLASLSTGGNNTAALIQALYNDARINTEAILARMELARGQVLTTGRFSFAAQPENGLKGIEADYGVQSSHLPTAAVAWTDHGTSDPLEQMRDWADLYTDDAGEPPAYALTSRQAIGHMLRNEAVRANFATLGGTPAVITRAQLAGLLDANDLPQLVQYDSQVYVGNSATRIIPANKMIYLPQNAASLGNTMWGITAEAMELAGLNNPQLTFAQAPGLVGMVTKEGDPVRTWTKVAAIGMPVISDANKLLTATLW